MENTLDTLFGPLSKQYCVYFYVLSIIAFVLMVLSLLAALFIGITKRKGIDFYVQMVIGSLAYLVVYFQNRLLHSMCVGNV